MSKKTITLVGLGEKFREKIFSGSTFSKRTNRLQGKILTIVDASYPEGVQRKAIKDLVKKEFIEELCYIERIVSGGRELEVTTEELLSSESVKI